MVFFAHLADVHLGGWREEKLKILGLKAFSKAINLIIEKNVDFVVIAGDFFNTAIPSIEVIKHATFELNKLKKNNIPVYVISGSHDHSPSGKTMLDVLENAELIINVQKNAKIENGKLKLKFYEYKNEKNNEIIKITGIPGKRQALESQFYEMLDYDYLEKEEGKKIFLFHMLLDEFKKPGKEKVPSISKSVLPKNFFYYGGGHPHLVGQNEYYEGIIAYPGPLFPNNFEELEELKTGGFYFVKYDGKIQLEWNKVFVKNVVVLKYNVEGKLSEKVTEEIVEKIKTLQLADSIFLLRVEGKLKGKISDINWNVIRKTVYERGAYFFSKNIYSLKSEDEKEFYSEELLEKNFLEENVIKEFEEQKNIPKLLPKNSLKKLIDILSEEKKEGETKTDFEKRLLEEFEKEFNIKIK